MNNTFKNIIFQQTKRAIAGLLLIFIVFGQSISTVYAKSGSYETCNYDSFLKSTENLNVYGSELSADPYNLSLQQKYANQVYDSHNIASGLSDFCLNLLYKADATPLAEWSDNLKGVSMQISASEARAIQLKSYATDAALRYMQDLIDYFDRAIQELEMNKKFLEEPSYLRQLSYSIAKKQEEARLKTENKKPSCLCSFINPETKKLQSYRLEISDKKQCESLPMGSQQGESLERPSSCVFEPGSAPSNVNILADEYFESYRAGLLTAQKYEESLGIARQYRTALRFILSAMNNAQKKGNIDKFISGDHGAFMIENGSVFTPQIEKAFAMPQIQMIKKIYQIVLNGDSYVMSEAEGLFLLFTARDFDERSWTEIAANAFQSLMGGTPPIPLDLGAHSLATDIYANISDNFDGKPKNISDKILLAKYLEQIKSYPLIVGSYAMMAQNIIQSKLMGLFVEAVPYLPWIESINKAVGNQFGLPAAILLETTENLLALKSFDLASKLHGFPILGPLFNRGYNRAALGAFGTKRLSRTMHYTSRAGNIRVPLSKTVDIFKRIGTVAMKKASGVAEYMARRAASKFVLMKQSGHDFIVVPELRSLVYAMQISNISPLKEIFESGVKIADNLKLAGTKKMEIVTGVSGSSLRGLRERSANDLDISVLAITLSKNADEASLEIAKWIKDFNSRVASGQIPGVAIDRTEKSIFGQGGSSKNINGKFVVKPQDQFDLNEVSVETLANNLKNGGDEYVQLVYKKETNFIDPSTGRPFLDKEGLPIKVEVPVNIHIDVGFRKVPEGKINAVSGIEGINERKRSMFGGQQFNNAYVATDINNDYFREIELARRYSLDILGQNPFSSEAKLNFVIETFKDAQKYFDRGEYTKSIKRSLIAGFLAGDGEIVRVSADVLSGNISKIDIISKSSVPPQSFDILKQVFFDETGVLYDSASVDFIDNGLWASIKSLEINPKTANWSLISEYLGSWVDKKTKEEASKIMGMVNSRLSSQ